MIIFFLFIMSVWILLDVFSSCMYHIVVQVVLLYFSFSDTLQIWERASHCYYFLLLFIYFFLSEKSMSPCTVHNLFFPLASVPVEVMPSRAVVNCLIFLDLYKRLDIIPFWRLLHLFASNNRCTQHFVRKLYGQRLIFQQSWMYQSLLSVLLLKKPWNFLWLRTSALERLSLVLL